jgi:1-acyl-sn-glycerol-3-phosphate acyltransferase
VPVAVTGSYRVFSKLKLNFGQPIDFSKYKKEKMSNEDYYELSQIVMEHIRVLKEDR